MVKIEGINIKNYRVLKDVTLGKLWNTDPKIEKLSPMTVVIGKNGVGKSSLFDAFSFLADCLESGVEKACDDRGRGGFDRIRSQTPDDDPIEFTIYYRENSRSLPITYELAIDKDASGRPYVSGERLRQHRKGESWGQPFSFLRMKKGKGEVWKGEKLPAQELDDDEFLQQLEKKPKDESAGKEDIELDERKLSIATLGALKQHPRIASFREFIAGWYLSYFTPAAARNLPPAGPERRLSVQGDNLSNVVQFMKNEHPKRFEAILKRIADKIPGINRIDAKESEDGRLLLRFNDKGFKDPFYAQQMSDGTLKAFAYLLMLEDPQPPPFICIEEPENGLYHKLLEILAQEFRNHAERESNASQIFITTHQPYFVDALEPKETWVLEKGSDGFSNISRASDDKIAKALCEEGLPLGGLWYSDYLDQR